MMLYYYCHNIFDDFAFALYTGNHENTGQIFCAPVGRDFYYAAAGADWVGLDGSNYVYVKIPVELWDKYDEFPGPDYADDTVYCVYYYPICHIYCRNFRL